MQDLFIAEWLIKQRIADKLPEIRSIFGINDNMTSVPVPGILVAFEGDEPIEPFNCSYQVVRQKWVVTLILPATYTVAEFGNAGYLMAEITRVLSGFTSPELASPLQRLEAAPVDKTDAYALYRTYFSCDLLLMTSEGGV